MSVPTPTIVVDPERHWCPAHLESFRADWPKGYLPASTILVFTAFTRLPLVWLFCENDAALLGEAIDSLAPICCKIDEGLLSRIIAASLNYADDHSAWNEIQAQLQRSEGGS